MAPEPILQESTTAPADLLNAWAGEPVRSWTELMARIDSVLMIHGGNQLVWRGVTDSRWGLYSSLYRRLKKVHKRVEEAQVLAAEAAILDRARSQWRFAHMGALELLAHIQHYGGPTRLLDVTENPLIATWFAVEQQRAPDGRPAALTAARVYCFYVGEYIDLDSHWGGRELPWNGWQDHSARIDNDWGTGKTRRVWRPPAYNERISAQNGGFIIDGVPFGFPGSNDFTKGPGDIANRWRISEIRDASSIPIKMNDPARARQRVNSRPAFSFVIAAEAREEIRIRLEESFGYSPGSIYSDLFGLAQNAAPHLPA